MSVIQEAPSVALYVLSFFFPRWCEQTRQAVVLSGYFRKRHSERMRQSSHVLDGFTAAEGTETRLLLIWKVEGEKRVSLMCLHFNRQAWKMEKFFFSTLEGCLLWCCAIWVLVVQSILVHVKDGAREDVKKSTTKNAAAAGDAKWWMTVNLNSWCLLLVLVLISKM